MTKNKTKLTAAALALVAASYAAYQVQHIGSHAAIKPKENHDVESPPVPPSEIGQKKRVGLFPDAPPEEAIAHGVDFSCMDIADDALRTECVVDFIRREGESAAHAIGAKLCAAVNGESVPSVLATCIGEWTSTDILGELEKVHSHCEGFGIRDQIKAAIFQLQASSPETFLALRSELIAESLYSDDRSEMAIVLAGAIGSATQDLDIREVLLHGAAGELGGTPRQITVSAVAVVGMLSEPDDVLAMIDSVIGSTSLPTSVGHGGGLGSALINILSIPMIQETQSEERIVNMLMAIMDHPIVGRTAATHIIHLQQEPLGHVSEETWANVLAHAKLIKIL